MTRHAFPDDESRLDVQRGEKCGGAMALIIMCHGGGPALLQRQSRLGPIKRLDLGLLVHAEYNGPIRWVEVKADDLGDFLLEHRVVRGLERLHDMRLETCIRPDAPDTGGRYAHRRRHHRAAPVRGIRRRLLHSLRDHLQPDLPAKRRNTRGSRLVALEPRHAFIEIPFLPAPNRRLRRACPPHDLNRPHAISCRKYDNRPPGEFARRVAVGMQSLRLGAVSGAKIKADVGASHPPFMPRLSGVGNPMSGVEHLTFEFQQCKISTLVISNLRKYQAEERKQTMRKFNVSIPSDVGFTDQLNQFFILHTLGAHLNLRYCHDEIFTTRSNARIWTDLKISEYLNCSDEDEDESEQRKFFIDVMDNHNGIPYSSISELLWKIRDVILGVDPKNIIVLRMRGQRKALLRLINELPPSAFVPFRQAFGAALANSGFPSPFSGKARLRIAFHIRKGDTARIEVPWHGPLTLYHDQVAISGVQVHDDVRLLRAVARNLISLFEPGDIEIVVFTDGYERSASLVAKKLKDNVLFTNERINLIKDLLMEKQKELEIFSSLPYTKVFIGEDYVNFQKLIMGVQAADIVITNGAQRLVPKLIGALPASSKIRRLIVIGADAENNSYNTDPFSNQKNIDYIPVPLKKFSMEQIVQACSAYFKNNGDSPSSERSLKQGAPTPQTEIDEEQVRELLRFSRNAPSISLALGRWREASEEISYLKKKRIS